MEDEIPKDMLYCLRSLTVTSENAYLTSDNSAVSLLS